MNLAAGSRPYETFAEHMRLGKETAREAARLRQQQEIFEIEQAWREEKQQYDIYDINNRPVRDLGATGMAILGALPIVASCFFYLVLTFSVPSGIELALFMFMVLGGAVLVLAMYHHGRRYEKAKADYLERLYRAKSAPILISSGMYWCGNKEHDFFSRGTKCPQCGKAIHIPSDGGVDQRTADGASGFHLSNARRSLNPSIHPDIPFSLG
jgi:hypothetical protein